MCTISIIPVVGDGRGERAGFRLVTNRDESRLRAAALAPRWREVKGRDGTTAAAVYPLDPVGGGTWVAASRGGLVLSLLNANLFGGSGVSGAGRAERLVSRGLIVTGLVGSEGARGAMAALGRWGLGAFAPFRLLAVEPVLGAGRSGGTFVALEARWDGRALTVEEHGAGAVCVVSSGLGDALVTPRVALFEETGLTGATIGGGAAAERLVRSRQDEFHMHRWEERPEISVRMARAEARTVSITTVECVMEAAGAQDPRVRVSMRYEPLGDDGGGGLVVNAVREKRGGERVGAAG